MKLADHAPARIAQALFIFLAMSACRPSTPTSFAQDQLGARYVPPANSTPTPTAFQPVPATPIILPTDYPTLDPNAPLPVDSAESSFGVANTWGAYPGPSAYPAIEIPPPLGLIHTPANQVNILLMGSDQRPNDGGFRTDVMLLLTLNPDDGTARLTSFPRDLFVYIPGWTMQRINTAQARGGFESTALMFEYNFGVKVDHWVLINFAGFISVIDGLGGIDVQAAQTLTDWRDGYGDYTIPAGSVHMNGDTALWYVRSRGTSSDFDRTRREQEVLQAIFFRVVSLDGVTHAPELYGQYQTAMKTDMTIEDIFPLLPLASQIAADRSILRFSVEPSMVTNWTNPYNGAQVLLPNRESILALMQQALGSQ